MVKSELATVVVPAYSGNYSDRRGMTICKFTPHHMAGDLTVEQCGNIFQNPNRNASSNYGIGTDGRIAIYVSGGLYGRKENYVSIDSYRGASTSSSYCM